MSDCDSTDCKPTRLLCPDGFFPRQDPGMGCHFLRWGIFPTQGPNAHLLCLLHWQVNALPLSHLVNFNYQIHSLQFSHSVMTDSLRPHEPQHARPPCPSPTAGVYPNPCPLSRWCHPTISSSVIPFSWPQSFPASWSFQMSQLFTSGGQSIGVSASTSVQWTPRTDLL